MRVHSVCFWLVAVAALCLSSATFAQSAISCMSNPNASGCVCLRAPNTPGCPGAAPAGYKASLPQQNIPGSMARSAGQGTTPMQPTAAYGSGGSLQQSSTAATPAQAAAAQQSSAQAQQQAYLQAQQQAAQQAAAQQAGAVQAISQQCASLNATNTTGFNHYSVCAPGPSGPGGCYDSTVMRCNGGGVYPY